jgi:hypothetical protein
MKVEIKLWVSRIDYEWNDKSIYTASAYKPTEDKETVIVGETTLEYEVPDDFNPIPAKVAALNKHIDTLADEYHGKVAKIKGQINDLLCLEAPAKA